jgi:hypothetical protein
VNPKPYDAISRQSELTPTLPSIEAIDMIADQFGGFICTIAVDRL